MTRGAHESKVTALSGAAAALLCALAASAMRPAESADDAAPLRLVADVPMPGAAVRFDYQSLDLATGRLYISHMNADQLVVFDTRARKVVANLDGFARVRGVFVVPERKRVYAAARATHEVVVVDTDSLKVVARVAGIRIRTGSPTRRRPTASSSPTSAARPTR